MGNTRLLRIAYIGDICLKFDTGMELVLHNVKYVPDMRLNIISTSLLDEDGYHNSSGNGLWKVTLGSLIVASGKKESKFYVTHPKISKSIVNVVDNDDMTELWHKKLGHMGEKGMSILYKKNMLSGMHDINLKKCSQCLAGKQTRLAFKSRSPFRRENILDLSGKDVSYYHLRVFRCKASVHIPKDERSKLDVKMFEEDLTLKDVENAERETIPQHKYDLIDLDPGADDVDAQEQPNLDEDVHPELPVPYMPPFLLLRRSTRDHHPSTCYSAHENVLLTDGGELECYAEAIEDEHKKEWFEAMEYEMNSLHKNDTFELVKLPKGKRALENKWVYKLKTEEHTSRPRYKARLVVKGFSQKRGIDFDEIFSSVVKMGSIRVVLGLAASLDLEKFGDDDFIILLLYVDDMLIVCKNVGRIPQLKRDLSKSFAMKDFGPAKQIIGIRILCYRGAKKLHISQEQYIEKVLCRFNIDKAKVVSSPLNTNFKLTNKDCPSSNKNIEKMDRVPYASAVGSLMYAMVCTRLDLAHVVGVISRFLSNPGKKHWEAVKWKFRYLRGTSKLGITFGNGKPMLVGYTYSDMAGNKDNMKSTSGYLMTFAGGAVSGQSR
ncbi:retrovirus-related pol polyprotein from transposon TNT 1-94 [Tanacetum coccineum]|uniref:Retrovirus-related pol polyprotein from transposon TNT 1-94 n=1 Tax=Tanacetum coccineum TaxID=301880 RepID=A0ABQ5E7F0_9ASTR